jgi:PAS domain S-box-containing protein
MLRTMTPIVRSAAVPPPPRATATQGVAVELLLEAGVVLAESLDLATTLGRIARLTVPRIADLCVIDLRDADGSIRQMAVASSDQSVAQDLRNLRERQQLDPLGEHPVARVIRSGQPERLAQMASAQLRSFAAGSEHAQFMLDHGYHSALVAPLPARQRTLGALSVLRLGDGGPYEEEDLELVCELARRAALAIDNARLFSEARHVEQRLAAILANLAEAITLTDEHGRIVFANQAAAELLGAATPQELVSATPQEIMDRFLILDEEGHELGLEHMPRTRLFAGEAAEPLLVRNIVRATGEERWLIARPSPIADPESGELLYAVNVYEDVTEVKRAEISESFMAEASRVLASSMDYTATLRQVARLAVPQLADWCAVDVIGEDGELERVATHHADPSRLELAERLARHRSPSEDAVGVPEVIRSGRARLYNNITPGVLAAYASDAEHLAMLQEIGATSVLIVPLAAPTRTIGAITLVSAESPRRLFQRDMALAERLGRRAGTAVESARLYTERKRIADVLQSALLPASLPEIPGVQARALYRAAGELNRVGGDFYDICECGQGRWMLAIGDVCGKGPRAAGVTALARHTLRAAAMLGQGPEGMLRTLHEALSLQPAGADMCTVCLVIVEPRDGRAQLTVALAGHPLPVLIDPAGSATQIGRPGTLLGVVDELRIHEVERELLPGETLLLYTDGVPEAGAPDRQIGEAGLLALCGEAPTLSLESFLARIALAASERAPGGLRDDIALLGVRLGSDRP